MGAAILHYFRPAGRFLEGGSRRITGIEDEEEAREKLRRLVPGAIIVRVELFNTFNQRQRDWVDEA